MAFVKRPALLNPMRNVLVLTLSLFLATQGTAWAQSSADCRSPEGIANATAQVEASLKSIQEGQRQREALLDKEVQATAKRLGWTGQEQSSFFTKLMGSEKFAGFEREKRPLSNELMVILKSASQKRNPSEPAVVCEAAVQVKSIVERIKEVNTRQYDFMSSEINSAK